MSDDQVFSEMWSSDSELLPFEDEDVVEAIDPSQEEIESHIGSLVHIYAKCYQGLRREYLPDHGELDTIARLLFEKTCSRFRL